VSNSILYPRLIYPFYQRLTIHSWEWEVAWVWVGGVGEIRKNSFNVCSLCTKCFQDKLEKFIIKGLKMILSTVVEHWGFLAIWNECWRSKFVWKRSYRPRAGSKNKSIYIISLLSFWNNQIKMLVPSPFSFW